MNDSSYGPIRFSDLNNYFLLRRKDYRRAWGASAALIIFACIQPAMAADAGFKAAPIVTEQENDLLKNLFSSALRFLAPRTLDPYTFKTLCLWGLDGLTAIDPSLTLSESHADPAKPSNIRLTLGQKVLNVIPEPPENKLGAWVHLVVVMMRSATEHSARLHAAGRDALVQSFFDELFNHLDPYSRYVAPYPAETDRANRSGAVASVGLTLKRAGSTIVIASINANGPAWAAGANVGQRLYAVDGRSTRNQSARSVERWLTGEAGSPVRLLIADPGHRGTVVTLRRERVPPQTVFSYNRGHVAILRISSFSSDTAGELSQNIDQALQDKHLLGLVFDLRNDRGGVLQQAVIATALVLDRGIAVVTKGRNPQANHVWTVQGGDMTHGIPLIILVDGRTASAAEIMAAALSDHRRAVVIGSSTLGKGLVQAVGQMPDGGELFVTWSRVLAPLGWPLQGLGVTPQVCTSRGALDVEQQLEALKLGHALDADTIKASRAVRPSSGISRILDIRRHCPAALGTETDDEVALSLLHNPASYRAALNAIPLADPDPGP